MPKTSKQLNDELKKHLTEKQNLETKLQQIDLDIKSIEDEIESDLSSIPINQLADRSLDQAKEEWKISGLRRAKEEIQRRIEAQNSKILNVKKQLIGLLKIDRQNELDVLNRKALSDLSKLFESLNDIRTKEKGYMDEFDGSIPQVRFSRSFRESLQHRIDLVSRELNL